VLEDFTDGERFGFGNFTQQGFNPGLASEFCVFQLFYFVFEIDFQNNWNFEFYHAKDLGF